MTKIVWDKVGERYYQLGLDRGVLYSPDELVTIGESTYPKGYPWNGLVSVDEDRENVSVTPIYYDGKKTMDIVSPGDFSATIKAITYPDEFMPFTGYEEIVPGISVDGQNRDVFGLSYRTKMGNDLNGELGYKIHILYNLTAVVETTTNKSTDSNLEPILFSWKLTSTPDEVQGIAPTAHVIIDSTKVHPDALVELEAILYGDDEREPRLPTIIEVFTYISLIVVLLDNGKFMAIGPPSAFDMLDEKTFQITSDNFVYLDANTYKYQYSE